MDPAATVLVSSLVRWYSCQLRLVHESEENCLAEQVASVAGSYEWLKDGALSTSARLRVARGALRSLEEL